MSNHHSKPGLQWDVFCQVVDNFGDLGVCWRLARDLAQRGHSVRLWVDDEPLVARMTEPLPGIAIGTWQEAIATAHALDAAAAESGASVVVEAFGCELPTEWLLRMRQQSPPPVWINLEYLSAEAYVERSHGLPSPQWAGPAAGLCKWFFYPGFTEGTGGLIREADFFARRAAHDRQAHRQLLGVPEGAFCVSVFCYPHAPVESFLQRWLADQGSSTRRWCLLATAGAWGARLRRWKQEAVAERAEIEVIELPWMRQDEYDQVLWSCDLNLVRGEDSAVRALWAGIPSLWQLYHQDDGAHGPKLDAVLQWAQAPAAWVPWWRAFNGLQPWPGAATAADWGALQAWATEVQRRLQQQSSLGERLTAFVEARMKG